MCQSSAWCATEGVRTTYSASIIRPGKVTDVGEILLRLRKRQPQSWQTAVRATLCTSKLNAQDAHDILPKVHNYGRNVAVGSPGELGRLVAVDETVGVLNIAGSVVREDSLGLDGGRGRGADVFGPACAVVVLRRPVLDSGRFDGEAESGNAHGNGFLPDHDGESSPHENPVEDVARPRKKLKASFLQGDGSDDGRLCRISCPIRVPS
jgi:hypothetical protein